MSFSWGGYSWAQETPPPPATKNTKESTKEEGPPEIADNSFLIEEAYNQEYGVVQHIQAFSRMWDSGDYVYSFIQEWPFNPAPRHQLSYTIFAARAGGFPGSGFGIGDIALNYRYQVVQNDRWAFAPRVSVLLPAGDSTVGRGSGGAGVQFNLPVSVTHSKWLVTHWNLGATIIPDAKNPAGQSAAVHGFNAGQSFIYKPHHRFNLMLETVYNSTEGVITPGKTQREHSLLLNPGFRWAYNLKNGTQIVPGISMPLGIGPSSGARGIFLYFSIEHPFGKRRDK
ncbi:MAG: transporter [Acidobacteriales bacterium]|nr:transporter [Terriglobales bacterium]